MAHMVECLLSKQEALGSNPIPSKGGREDRAQRCYRGWSEGEWGRFEQRFEESKRNGQTDMCGKTLQAKGTVTVKTLRQRSLAVAHDSKENVECMNQGSEKEQESRACQISWVSIKTSIFKARCGAVYL